MKKLVSMLLVIALSLSLSVGTFANTPLVDNAVENKDVIYLQDVGNGQLNESLYPEKGSIVATATDDAEIFHISEERYAAQVHKGIYLLVDKIPVSTITGDYASRKLVYNVRNVPSVVCDSIETTIAAQAELGNKSFEVVLFAPTLIQKENIAVKSTLKDPNSVRLNAVESYSSNYSAYGYNWTDYFTKYTNLSISEEVSGTTVKPKMSDAVSISATIVGLANSFFSYLSTGLSLYTYFTALFGTVSTASSGDRAYVNLIFDKLEKTTVGRSSPWLNETFMTHKVWLNRADHYQYYSSKGNSRSGSVYLNSTLYTANYNSAVETIMYGVLPISRIENVKVILITAIKTL